jgi:hypothetical protein
MGMKMTKHTFLKIFGWVMTLAFLPVKTLAQYQTLGPASCGLGQTNCHARENGWWTTDAHHNSLDRFYDPDEECLQIAKLYGITPADMLKGNKGCMRCHGTVISEKAARESEYGVSCESCHGPGSGYKDPHSEKPGGYEKALKLGLVELENLDKRAVACVYCHYITEPKLISAGHSTGEKFNYVTKMKTIANPNHWKKPLEPADQLRPAFAKALKARGPAPVATAPPTPKPTPSAPNPPPVTGEVTEAPPPTSPPPRPRPAPRPPTPRPVLPTTPPAEDVQPLTLDPFPSVSDSTSLQELILILKRRLEYLYQKTGGIDQP